MTKRRPMRTTRKLVAIATLFTAGLAGSASAQTTTTNRWLPRFGEIFSGKKSSEADKKSKAPAPKTQAKDEKPPTLTIDRIPPDVPLVTVEKESTRLMEILVELALL